MNAYKEMAWMYFFTLMNQSAPWGSSLFDIRYMHPKARIKVYKRIARYGDSYKQLIHTWECEKRHQINKKNKRKKNG